MSLKTSGLRAIFDEVVIFGFAIAAGWGVHTLLPQYIADTNVLLVVSILAVFAGARIGRLVMKKC